MKIQCHIQTVFEVHNILLENNDGTDWEIELLDQYRTPLTDEMVELSLKNYKSWMNSNFYIEIRVDNQVMSADAECEVRK